MSIPACDGHCLRIIGCPALTGIFLVICRSLDSLSFAHELADLPVEKVDDVTFRLNNPSFSSGDAEYWYQIIRAKKPRRIYEIGSGHSTLMAVKAVRQNQAEDTAYQCEHVCIEPYEMPWLEKIGISIVRQKVKDVDIAFFSAL